MTHTELVQVATDLLFQSADAEKWLSQYDLALASDTDTLLTEFISQLKPQLSAPSHRLAA
jgi:hypothetical protein